MNDLSAVNGFLAAVEDRFGDFRGLWPLLLDSSQSTSASKRVKLFDSAFM